MKKVQTHYIVLWFSNGSTKIMDDCTDDIKQAKAFINDPSFLDGYEWNDIECVTIVAEIASFRKSWKQLNDEQVRGSKKDDTASD